MSFDVLFGSRVARMTCVSVSACGIVPHFLRARGVTEPFARRAARALLGVLAAWMLAMCAATAFPSTAYAEDYVNPCVPTLQDLEACEADGTLAQRQAFQESLGHGSVSPELLQSVIARQQQLEGISAYAEGGHQPIAWAGGCPTVGTAKVLGLRVSFPDRSFAEGDTLEAFQALFTGGDSAGAFPYESLDAYYNRASYGALSFKAQTFDYEAQHELDYYDDNSETMQALFQEALDALIEDGKLSLSDFDGNEDGMVDAVYLHFACDEGDAQWGTPLWSQQWKVEGLTYEEEGKTFEICKVATLHEPSNTESAARTLIHETGHVLGLPDYYRYDYSGVGAGTNTDRTGILSFDMMFDNKGDHNGFSKWLLGWIDEDRMTHVTATADGIRVQDSTGSASYEPGTPFDVALNTFSQFEGGGQIAIVANHDTQGTGMFSSYYLVEYDGCEGNNTVQYQTDFAGTQGEYLPSGFRVFRVQAKLDAMGVDFMKRNTTGPVHDQLIELVDPDESASHVESGLYVPSVIESGASGYGCMLFEGSGPITPTSTPVTTNFYESLTSGFTGLSFEAIETGGAVGTMRISHSEEGKPDPSSFSLECLTEEILNVGTIELEASSAPILATWEQGYEGGDPYLMVGGVRVFARAETDGNRVILSYCINAHELQAGATAELVLPAGMFVVGANEEGEPLFSNEMVFDSLKVGNLTQVESGQYANGETQGRNRALSNVVRDSAGSLHFVRLDAATPEAAYVCSVDPEDVGSMSETSYTLAGGEALFDPGSLNDATLVATVLPQDKIALSLMPDAVQGRASGEFFVLDLASGSAVHVPGLSAYGDSLAVGSTLVQMPSGWTGFGVIAAFDAQAETPAVAYSKTTVERIVPAGEGKTGLLRHVYGEGMRGQVIDIVSTAALEEALRSGAPTLDDAGNTLADIPVLDTLFIEDEMEYPVGVASAGEGYAAIVQAGDFNAGILEADWVTFDSAGKEASRHRITGVAEGAHLFMQEAPGGTVAFSSYPQQSGLYWAPQHTVFLDAQGNTVSSMVTYTKAVGAWLTDGSWFNVGWDVNASPGAAGSPEVSSLTLEGEDGASGVEPHEGEDVEEGAPWFDRDAHIRWVHTGILDSGASGPDPGPGEGEGGSDEGVPGEGGEGEQPGGGSGDAGNAGTPGASQGQQGHNNTFAKTNDSLLPVALIALCGCCIGAAVLITAVNRARRSGE